MVTEDHKPVAGFGRPPENRQEALRKLLWIGIWLAFLGAPVSDLLKREHTAWATVLGWLALVAFVAVYLALVFRHTARPFARATVASILVFLASIAVVTSLTLDAPWLVLFVYVSVGCGAVLPLPLARWAIPGATAAMALIGLTTRGDWSDFVPGLAIPALLGGFAMTGVRHLVRTTVELRQARATVAQLAANEERLRLARDLHDLLGHSLSLITLKSELAGRMLPDRPDQAAQQVADIEQVSRQALVDVREAVTGYRRATLTGELAGARTALTAAGVAADLPVAAELPPGLPPGAGEALAWVVREAVTNVVRHSGARRCVITLGECQTLDGRFLELKVADDGRGGSAVTAGNGLTGLAERLSEVAGKLEPSTQKGKGFTLTARVPLL
ncbi:sensor histidine kinase [Streptomyces sp. BPTC-684]|uniref:sensor histidine kinase n=1 Tax=Streptomyces sp. BPTC-684 TaxID=3043734 RepID=UPI0024B25C9A|nr:sensor histidine kinase [Streptomyces sp. BPTC-684]WHM41239.1 sensor histidine kinase [Streptomyces sp. BPTC-684]